MSRTSLIVAPLGLLLLLPMVGGQRPTRRPDVTPHLSLMGFTLERSTLADVQNKLGASVAGACSEQEEASKMICYVSKGRDKTRIFFQSGFSGGWSVLDGFKVFSGALDTNCHFQCVTSATLDRDVQTAGGLRLGLTRQELILLLGFPTKVNGSHLRFEWQSTRRMTKTEIDKETQTFQSPVTRPYFDVLDSIDVTLTNSKVTEFEVRRTTTY